MNEYKATKNLSIENAKIFARNFSGLEGKYNPAGRRTFCVLVENDIADDLINDGWNIKWLKPRDEDDEPQAYISVVVSYRYNPPTVYMIAGNKKMKLEEDRINILDWAEIENVDIVIRPYNWEVNGQTGVKAYLKNMYVTIVRDEFADKYDDIPESATSVSMED